jgi:NAD(P)-dependent dehydrogenase (short-subunit alcohol dehydrogenase family)
VANVAADDDVQRMIEKATSTYGRLDILCNNAGIMDAMTPAADVPLALWDRVLAINLTGPFLACRRAIPLMLQQGGGSIVNTASEAEPRARPIRSRSFRLTSFAAGVHALLPPKIPALQPQRMNCTRCANS